MPKEVHQFFWIAQKCLSFLCAWLGALHGELFHLRTLRRWLRLTAKCTLCVAALWWLSFVTPLLTQSPLLLGTSLARAMLSEMHQCTLTCFQALFFLFLGSSSLWLTHSLQIVSSRKGTHKTVFSEVLHMWAGSTFALTFELLLIEVQF